MLVKWKRVELNGHLLLLVFPYKRYHVKFPKRGANYGIFHIQNEKGLMLKSCKPSG